MICLAERLGQLDALVRYPIAGQVFLDVPVYRKSNRWDRADVMDYELDFVSLMSNLGATLPAPVELIDCGADIGTFSVLMAARCPFLRRIRAFEPNPEVSEVLEANLRHLATDVEVHHAAVSSFNGCGRLVSPDYDDDDHARFIAPDPAGAIRVRSIDSLDIEAETSLVIKIDVEGGEQAVLAGARETLGRVQQYVVAFEANRNVVRRTGVDPVECVRLLRSVRPCTVQVSERPEAPLSMDRPFFEQFHDRPTYNVVCWSS